MCPSGGIGLNSSLIKSSSAHVAIIPLSQDIIFYMNVRDSTTIGICKGIP